MLGQMTWRGHLALPEHQRYFVEAFFKHKRVFLSTARLTGKSHAMGGCITPAFWATAPSQVLMLAPTLDTVKGVLWARVDEAWRNADAYLESEGSPWRIPGDLNKSHAEIDAQHTITALPTRNPERVRGQHAGIKIPGDPDQDFFTEEDMLRLATENPTRRVLLAVDELQGIDDEVFRTLDGMLSNPNVWCVWAGNPYVGMDDNHRFMQLLKDRGSGFHTIKVGLLQPEEMEELGVPPDPIEYDKVFYGVPEYMTPRAAIDKLIRQYEPTDPIFLSDVCGQPSEGSIERLIVTHTILIIAEDLWPNNHRKSGPGIGVDVGTAKDLTVIILTMDGKPIARHAFVPGREDREAQVTIARKIVRFMLDWGKALREKFGVGRWGGDPIPANRVHIDDTAMVGVCDILSSMGYNVDRVGFGESADGDNIELTTGVSFKNKRGEMHWVVRRGLQEGWFTVPDLPTWAPLRAQMQWTHFEKEAGPKGPIVVLEPKDNVKKEHQGVSPDDMDAFILSVREPVSLEVVSRYVPPRRDGSLDKRKAPGKRLPGSRML